MTVFFTPGFKLCHRLHSHGFGGGVGFLLNENVKFKILDSPTYTSFENIVIGIGSFTSSFVISCVYRPPGSCSDEFFTNFSIFLSICLLLVPHFLCAGISIFMWTLLLVTVLNF